MTCIAWISLEGCEGDEVGPGGVTIELPLDMGRVGAEFYFFAVGAVFSSELVEGGEVSPGGWWSRALLGVAPLDVGGTGLEFYGASVGAVGARLSWCAVLTVLAWLSWLTWCAVLPWVTWITFVTFISFVTFWTLDVASVVPGGTVPDVHVAGDEVGITDGVASGWEGLGVRERAFEGYAGAVGTAWTLRALRTLDALLARCTVLAVLTWCTVLAWITFVTLVAFEGCGGDEGLPGGWWSSALLSVAPLEVAVVEGEFYGASVGAVLARSTVLTWITRVAFVTLVSLVAFLTLAGATGAATVVDEVLDVCAEGLVEVVEGDNVRGDDAGLVDCTEFEGTVFVVRYAQEGVEDVSPLVVVGAWVW